MMACPVGVAVAHVVVCVGGSTFEADMAICVGGSTLSLASSRWLCFDVYEAFLSSKTDIENE